MDTDKQAALRKLWAQVVDTFEWSECARIYELMGYTWRSARASYVPNEAALRECANGLFEVSLSDASARPHAAATNETGRLSVTVSHSFVELAFKPLEMKHWDEELLRSHKASLGILTHWMPPGEAIPRTLPCGVSVLPASHPDAPDWTTVEQYVTCPACKEAVSVATDAGTSG